jgi:Tripartite tricarboxylate transporter family receptor
MGGHRATFHPDAQRYSLTIELPAGRAVVPISAAALVPTAGAHSEIQSTSVCDPSYRRGGHIMDFARRQLLHLAAGAAALPVVSRIARAQTYPSRPITIVVPFAAGGSTDTIARVMAERMKSSLGQSVIVEDVTGAGGTIAVGRVARAAPDGYTLA